MSSWVFIPSLLEDTSHLEPEVAALAWGLVQSEWRISIRSGRNYRGGYYGHVLLSTGRNGGSYVNERQR